MKKQLVCTWLLAAFVAILPSCEFMVDTGNVSSSGDIGDIIATPEDSSPKVPVSTPENNLESECDETLALAQNQSYKFWLPCEYDYISSFSSGFGLLISDGEYSLIDENNIIIPSTSEYEVVNLYKDVVGIKSRENGKYGLMSRNGDIIFSPQFDSPLEFKENMAAAVKNDKVGYINTSGELVVDYLYNFGCPFSEGLAAVGVDDQFWFINTLGGLVSGPYEFLGSEVFSNTLAYMKYSEGYTSFFVKRAESTLTVYGGDGYWGYLDTEGNIAITAEYTSVRPFCEGLAAVRTKYGDWIYIDYDGNKVMEGAPSDFLNGLACIGSGFIDKSGKVVIAIPEDYQIDFSTQTGINNFHDGLVVLSKLQEEKFVYSVMDIHGQIVLELKDFEEVKVFKKGLIAVKLDNKWGIIDALGL